jgi:hypothetical protein
MMFLHADAIAEDRAACERTRGIDRDNSYLAALLPEGARQVVHERALSGTRRAGYPYG